MKIALQNFEVDTNSLLIPMLSTEQETITESRKFREILLELC